jgi:endo-1,4-beta-xylanase
VSSLSLTPAPVAGSPSPTPAPPTQPTPNPGPSLRAEAGRIGWHIGCEVTGYEFNDPAWQALMGAQFSQVTIDWGMYWPEVEPSRGQFSFSTAEREVTWAAANEMRIRGQALVFPSQLPPWVSNGRLSAADLRSVLRNHVATVVGHFKGAIAEWVVVNEPYIAPYFTADVFWTTLGPTYIDLAFEVAREADPAALLLFNDTDNHRGDGITTGLTLDTARRLHANGLIDRVGLEMHLDGANPPDPADVVRTMRRYPVPVCVTEFDIDLSNVPGSTAERYAAQARIAASMLRAARDSGVCESFTVWGIGDGVADKWLQQPGAPAPMATPFDGQLRPKPFFSALLKGMS